MRTTCKNVARYKGVRVPACRGGRGCWACWAIWFAVHAPMKTLFAVLVLGLAGCGSPTYCRTRCGLALKTPGACAPLQAQEDTVLALYASRGLFHRGELCAAFAGYTITVPATNADGAVWEPESKQWVAGYTDCANGAIVVANQRWHAGSNSLSHELLHVVQRCSSTIHNGSIDQHYQWRERGYYDAIEAARPDKG